MTLPSASVASIEVTLSTISPYRIERAPAELFPVIPPMVAWLAVATSTGKNSPFGASDALR